MWVPPHLSSAGQEAVDLAALAGLKLDPWQQLVLDGALAEDRNHRWTCFEVCLIVSRQNGKGPYALDYPILTDSGWTTFADIRPGQKVYGADGKLTDVVAVSEVFPSLDCYEVTFTDGSKHTVGGSHIWHVRTPAGKWQNLATEEIAKNFRSRRPDGRTAYRYRVRCDATVETPHADLPIDPYLLGYWLGDGTAATASITVGAQDKEWVSGRIEAAGATIQRTSRHDHGHAWGLHFSLGGRYASDGFLARARALGVLGDKHIPEIYLTASPEQRMALLAGLMDSDGSIATTNRSPQVEFSTSYPRLAETFHRLARSLGIRVAPKWRKTAGRDNCRFLWTPTFDPFEMPRKSEKFKPPSSARQQLMSVTDVRRVPTVPTRCIQVAAEDGIFLVGHHFTPTHNSILEALELAGLFLFDDDLIIHSAHLFSTSKEHFARISHLIRNCPELHSQVKKYSASHGEEAIELRNGKRLKFMARTGSAGRGFSGDRIVFDEAMYLDAMAMQAMLPTLSTRPNAQVWYTGSAGFKTSEHFGSVRRRGLRGATGQDGDPSLAFFEWSIDERPVSEGGDARDAPRSWRKANPGMGYRITESYVRKEAAAFGGTETAAFGQERLGIGDWPDEDEAWAIVDRGAWVEGACDYESQIVGPLAFGFDADPETHIGAIGVVGMNVHGKIHYEVVAREPGTAWIADWLISRDKIWHPLAVCVIPTSPAASTIARLEDAGINITRVTTTDYARSCGAFYTDVMESRTAAHRGQMELQRPLGGARKKDLAEGGWIWSRKETVTDLAPLIAVTLARHGFAETANRGKEVLADFGGSLTAPAVNTNRSEPYMPGPMSLTAAKAGIELEPFSGYLEDTIQPEDLHSEPGGGSLGYAAAKRGNAL
jgi:hypothetical protein